MLRQGSGLDGLGAGAREGQEDVTFTDPTGSLSKGIHSRLEWIP
jgi:hypothetical protein